MRNIINILFATAILLAPPVLALAQAPAEAPAEEPAEAVAGEPAEAVAGEPAEESGIAVGGGLIGIGAGIIVVGAGLGIGKFTAAAVESIARQPQAAKDIQSAFQLPLFLLEGVAVIGLGVLFVALLF